MRNLVFLISDAQRNFSNKLLDSVEVQRNSAIAERHFRTKLKRSGVARGGGGGDPPRVSPFWGDTIL